MPACSACGRESPAGFAFCPGCGSPLASPARERRKVATLVFCDVSGSTALGERVDAESVRELMFRYFHAMRGAVEGHGGTVEKFVGDAVLAVFGVPVVHEDDALRAVRAAWEMQARVVGLNEELVRRVGVRIALRIGVSTGEVVAGDASSRETFVTGDAVNTAARLEQAAAPGEVLIGEATYRLVRDAVVVEAVAPLAARGKAEPVPAYRLLGVSVGAAGRERRLDAELVGRQRELAALLAAWEQVLAEGRCRLLTLVGEPGVGKSRLARELVARLPDARVLSGRCLPYGEGITWWPLAEIVRDAAAIRDEHGRTEARARIASCLRDDPDGRAAASALAQALGLAEGAATVEEIAWAARRLLAALARDRPALVVVDDVQWGEEALLDFLESLPALGGEEPLLCLCLARPELLEARPMWPNVVALEPLAGADAAEHARVLIAAAGIDQTAAERVRTAAGGNPLFAEELVAMLRESPEAAMPASLSALLAERLDRLAEPERRALECGAVEGEVFHRGAVAALAGEAVDAELEALRERAFLRPARALLADEAAFRFRHLLVRDAAYNGTAKRTRAELHERFADWLVQAAGERLVEVEEIVGYHLEHAHRNLADLGPVDRPDLALRAVQHLGAAGLRAVDRGDAEAAASLLERAIRLPGDERVRLELLLEHAVVLVKTGAGEDADRRLRELEEHADPRRDERLLALAAVEREYARLRFGEFDVDAGVEVCQAAAATLHALGDARGEARALARALAGLVAGNRYADAVDVGRRALALAQGAGSRREDAEIIEWLVLALVDGPTPFDEIERFVEEELDSADRPSLEWLRLLTLGIVRGAAGDADEARSLIARATAITRELGLEVNAAATSMQLVLAERLAGDVRDSERALWEALVRLEAMDAIGPLASVAGYLGLLLCEDGRLEEAETFARRADELAVPADVEARVLGRAVRARIEAARGDGARAEALARETVSLAACCPFDVRLVALEALGEVLAARGRVDEAGSVLERASRHYERKGCPVASAATRVRLAGL